MNRLRLSGCLVLIGWSCVLTFAQEPEDRNVPTFEIDSLVVSEWLLLGPLPRDQRLPNPAETLREPYEGLEVQLPDGTTCTWTVFKANDQGKVDLAEFCNQKQMTGKDMCVYAFTKLRDAEPQERQFFVGFDDGGRVWLDGQQILEKPGPGFYVRHQNRLSIPFEEDDRNCLIEISNWGGDFVFGMTCGYSFEGWTMTRSRRPVEDVIVTVVSDNVAQGSAISSDDGRFEFRAIPYGTNVHLKLQSGAEKVRYPEQGTLEGQNNATVFVPKPITVSHRTFRSIPGMPSMDVCLPAEMSDGTLLIGNNSDHSLYRFNGLRFYKVSYPQLHGFTESSFESVQVDPQQSIWVSTYNDGIYRFREGELTHWSHGKTGAKPKIFFAGDGSVWVAPLMRGPVVLRIEPNDSVTEIQLPAEADIVSVVEHQGQLVFAPKTGNLICRDSDGAFSSFDADTPSYDKVRKLIVRSGSLWIAAQTGLYQLDPEGECRYWAWPSSSNQTLGNLAICDNGNVWASYGNQLYLIIKDTLVPVYKTMDIHPRLICSSLNSLFCVSGHTLVELSYPEIAVLDHSDGIGGDRIFQSTMTSRGIVVSSNFHEHGRVFSKAPEETGPDGVYDTSWAMEAGPDDRRVGFIHGLTRYIGEVGTTQLPQIVLDGQWSPVKSAPWSSRLHNIYNFCEFMNDGRAIIGSLRGLMELKGSELVASDLLPDSFYGDERNCFNFYELFETSSGAIWIAYAVVDEDSESGIQRTGVVKRDGDELHQVPFEESGLYIIHHIMEFDGRIYLGSQQGLFYLDEQRQTARRFPDGRLRYANITGMEIDAANKLWIATASDGIFLLNDESLLTRLTGIDGLEPDVRVNDLTPDQETMWISTNKKLIGYRSSNVQPRLFVDPVESATAATSGDSHAAEFVTECNQNVTFRLAARDDAPVSTFRYRTNGGEWKVVNSSLVHLCFPESGRYSLEFQAIDRDQNPSNTRRATIVSFLPLWRQPVARTVAALAITFLVLLTILFWFRRRSAEKQLLASETLARRERELLLARVCHDLRNPLSVVVHCAELLNDPRIDRRQLAELLGESSASMTYLTDQLLNYSKSINDTRMSESETVSVAEVMQRIQAMVTLRFRNSPVKFRAEIEGDAPRHILVEKEALIEMLCNLIDNAFRYTDSGLVTLTFSKVNSGVRFEVSDTGCGIEQELLTKIFDPFVRGKKTHEKGVGLGMAIVHRLINKMGGTIDIVSHVGAGTSVSVRFPKSVVCQIDDRRSPVVSAIRVFVIDDDAAIRETLVNLFEFRGNEVGVADDTVIASEVASFAPDVVLVDIAMPFRNGIDVAGELRQHKDLSDVTIVGMSASSELLIDAQSSGLFTNVVLKSELLNQQLSKLDQSADQLQV